MCIKGAALKKIILLLLFLFSGIIASAQDYNYQEYSIGAGGSITRAYVDVAQQKGRRAFNLNANYNYSPFVTVGGELQIGKLAGGDQVDNAHLREFANSYTAFIIYADLQAGEIIDYDNSLFLDALKNFYAGTGIGAIRNKMILIERVKPDGSGYVFPGKDKSINLLVPFRFGYEFKIYNNYGEPQIRLNLGYQMNVTFGEGLDGYNDPPSKFKNNALDMYSQMSVGIKFGFGNLTSYHKPIRY